MVSTPTKPAIRPTPIWRDSPGTSNELSLLLHFPDDTPLSDKLFEQISRLNRPWQFERTADGDLVVMAPAGYRADGVCMELGSQLATWARSGIGGVVTGSSGGYVRADGHTAAPDAAWTSRERLATLTAEQRAQTFLPLCPDFVIEVRSGSDTITSQQRKMAAWIAGGTRLGWLVVPEHETVHVYRRGEPVAILQRPDTLSADPVCAGLTFTFEYVWDLESARDLDANAE